MRQDRLAEFLRCQPFPRVEFEQGADQRVVLIDDPPACVDPDLVDQHGVGIKPRLHRQFAHVGRGNRVLVNVVVHMGEPDPLVGDAVFQRSPALQQAFVQAVQLVRLGKDLLFPEPLHDGGFQHRGGRVAVVFEQLGRTAAVIAEVKPAIVQRGRLGLPCVAHGQMIT